MKRRSFCKLPLLGSGVATLTSTWAKGVPVSAPPQSVDDDTTLSPAPFMRIRISGIGQIGRRVEDFLRQDSQVQAMRSADISYDFLPKPSRVSTTSQEHCRIFIAELGRGEATPGFQLLRWSLATCLQPTSIAFFVMPLDEARRVDAEFELMQIRPLIDVVIILDPRTMAEYTSRTEVGGAHDCDAAICEEIRDTVVTWVQAGGDNTRVSFDFADMKDSFLGAESFRHCRATAGGSVPTPEPAVRAVEAALAAANVRPPTCFIAAIATRPDCCATEQVKAVFRLLYEFTGDGEGERLVSHRFDDSVPPGVAHADLWFAPLPSPKKLDETQSSWWPNEEPNYLSDWAHRSRLERRRWGR